MAKTSQSLKEASLFRHLSFTLKIPTEPLQPFAGKSVFVKIIKARNLQGVHENNKGEQEQKIESKQAGGYNRYWPSPYNVESYEVEDAVLVNVLLQPYNRISHYFSTRCQASSEGRKS